MWRGLSKILFFALVVKPVMLLFLGLKLRNGERLPVRGPAILAANHNSHLDTNLLMSLFPLALLPKVRPVAAADYFHAGAFLRWFSETLFGILPITRGGGREEMQAICEAALDRGEILILFPEGTRGSPEQIAPFKKGVAFVARSRPQVPVIPIFLHGLGKSLPRGSWLPVPFFIDVMLGEPMPLIDDPGEFTAELERRVRALAEECRAVTWDQ